MTEIDRVRSAIAAYFDASGVFDLDPLRSAIERCLVSTERRYMEVEMKAPDLLTAIIDVRTALEETKENLPEDRTAQKEVFYDLSHRAMVARRGTYSLENAERPWEPLDAEAALLDDGDMYAFGIFDTLAEEIQSGLPSLFQLSVEGDWEGDDLVSDADEAK